MGKYAQADPARAVSDRVDREADADRRMQRGAGADLSIGASGTLGSTLNQSAQVQRLASLGGTMNSGPNAGGLAQLRASLNPVPSPNAVVQRANDVDPFGDAWLHTWYGKKPGGDEKALKSETNDPEVELNDIEVDVKEEAKESSNKRKPAVKKRMTAERKYTQMLNNVLRVNQPKGRKFEDRVNSVIWDDMKGDLLSTMISFHTHIAPQSPLEGHGFDRGSKGTGGKYYRGNAHRYKDIYKGIAAQIPSIQKDLEKPADPTKKPKPRKPKEGTVAKAQRQFPREVLEPLNKPLVDMLTPLAEHSADINRVTESEETGAYLFDPNSTYREFGTLAVAQNNFVVLEKAQKLFDSYNAEAEHLKKIKISELLLGEYGADRGYKGTGRQLLKGDKRISAQAILPDIAKSLEGLSQPATEEPFHDFMLRDRGETVNSLSEMVNDKVFTEYQAVGAEKHPSLILHKIGEAKTPKEQTAASRKFEREFIANFQDSGHGDDWAEPVTKRSSFGFVRPTISRVGESIRLWPGYAPKELLARGIKKAVGIADTGTESVAEPDPSAPVLHVEALKAAVRHALIALKRGNTAEFSENRAALRDWLQTRIAINLRKAQYLLTLARDGYAVSRGSKEEISDKTTSGTTASAAKSNQHYVKSAEVIERLQEYAFQYSALTFKRKETSVESEDASAEPTEADPYEQYLQTAAFVKGRQHKTFYLDSGLQGLNIANLLIKHIQKEAIASEQGANESKQEKGETEPDIYVKMHHSYFENESVRASLKLKRRSDEEGPQKHDIVSADLSPVLIKPLRDKERLSPQQHKREIKESLASGAIPVLDVTNTSLKNVNDLIAEKSGTSQTENFIIAESLVKHSQLGADKYAMGRLVVVGNEAFIKKAEAFIKPFADAASHPLLQEFRRNMDEVLYGGAVVDLSEIWTAGFAERARSYTPFMVAMGFEKPWLDAMGQGDPESSESMNVSTGKQTVGASDPNAGWELLHRAFDKYVERTVEPVGKDSTALDVAFSTLPLPDQNELRRRVEQILLPDDVKRSASFADLATGWATQTGISNAGNSCYLAAGLNMLAFSGYFDFFAANVELDERHGALKATIAGILDDIRAGKLITRERITDLLTALDQRQLLPAPAAEALGRGTRATGAQQDPNEVFFRKILDYFGKAFADFKLTQAYRTEIQGRDTNVAVGGDIAKYSALDNSNSFSTRHDDLAVELPITGAADLRNAMARYLAAETISGVKYVDQTMDGHTVFEGEGRRTIGLGHQAPYTLTISLKRWAGLHKDERAIDMPERFTLNGFVYRLDAVVYHRGRQSTSGHYTASTRTPNGNDWQYRDDKAVASDPNVAARSQFGYLYTYTRERAATQDDALLNIGNPGPYVALPVVDVGRAAHEGMEIDEKESTEPKKKGSKPGPKLRSKRSSSKMNQAAKSELIKREREPGTHDNEFAADAKKKKQEGKPTGRAQGKKRK